MPTTNVINSTLFAIHVLDTTYKKIAHMTDASFSLSMEPRDITTKDSAGYRALLEGLRSWSMSSSNLVAFDAGYGVEELRAALVARTTVTLRWMTGVSGDQYAQGSAYVTSVEENSPGAEDNVSFSVTFEGTGAVTFVATT
jgi:TP901-1 family phage major tail protein